MATIIGRRATRGGFPDQESLASLVFGQRVNTGRVQSILRPSIFTRALFIQLPGTHFLGFLLCGELIVENEVSRGSISNRVEESK